MTTTVHRRLRFATDRAARLCGILAHRERVNARGLTVLMYHRVLPDERCTDYPLPSLAMPVSAFREQMAWLAEHGEVLTLGRALERNRERAPGDRPLFAVTIDDGYGDSAHFVAPALEDAGLRGTFFVTTGFVGTRELLWFDRAVLLFQQVPAERRREIVLEIFGERGAIEFANAAAWVAFLKRCSREDRYTVLDALERAAGAPLAADEYRSMTIGQVGGLHERGHEVGSHTVTHPSMHELDSRALRDEVELSRRALEDWLGCEVAGFCYPNGDHDERVASAVACAGYRYACTTRDGIHCAHDDPLRIRRVDVVPERVLDSSRRFDPTGFRRELCGLYRRRARAEVTR